MPNPRAVCFPVNFYLTARRCDDDQHFNRPVIMAEQKVERYPKRFLFYCKEYYRGRVFNGLFKAAVNSMLIDSQKVEGSFCIGKCIIFAEDLLQGLQSLI